MCGEDKKNIPKLELNMPFAFVTTTRVLSMSSGQIMWSMPGGGNTIVALMREAKRGGKKEKKSENIQYSKRTGKHTMNPNQIWHCPYDGTQRFPVACQPQINQSVEVKCRACDTSTCDSDINTNVPVAQNKTFAERNASRDMASNVGP